MLHRLLSEARGEVLLWAHGGHPAARRLAAQHGLEPLRELLQLRRMEGPGETAGVSIRPAGYSTGEGAGDVDALLRVNARAFAEHPEQGRLTRAEFDALAAEPWFDADDVLLAWDSDRLAGFCWLKVEGGTGEFYVVGVDPDYQGQGWGRELVRVGLARLASRGIQNAHLYVEADNAAALRLYREFGFAEHSIDIQYRWAGGPWE
jgi:mycothiol synthase